MISIDLSPGEQQRLEQLARRQGQDGPDLARRIVLDYLGLEALTDDSEDRWAEASVALAPEIMGTETWDGRANGP